MRRSQRTYIEAAIMRVCIAILQRCCVWREKTSQILCPEMEESW